MKSFVSAVSKHRWPYLFIAPFFVLFLVFQLFPMIWTFYMSTQSWNGLAPAEFVGIDNYVALFKDNSFWDAFFNTGVYWIANFLLMLPLAMGISLLLKASGLRKRRFFSTVTFFPYVCATVAMGLIFNIIFDNNVGLFSQITQFLGLAPIDWLTSTETSKIPVIILHVWRNTPWFTLIIFTALLNVPEELYEAAHVDGANPVQQFFFITIPSLGSAMVFCFIMITVESWQMFTEPYILKGPATSNISLFQYMYENSFELFKLGYGATIGVVLTVILAVLSVTQLVLMRKQNEV